MEMDYPPEPPPATPPAAEPQPLQPAAASDGFRLVRQPRMSWERTAQDYVRAHLGQQWDQAAFKRQWEARRAEGEAPEAAAHAVAASLCPAAGLAAAVVAAAPAVEQQPCSPLAPATDRRVKVDPPVVLPWVPQGSRRLVTLRACGCNMGRV